MSRRDTTEFDTVNATVIEPYTAEMGAFKAPIFLAAGYKFVNSKKGKETRNFSYALE